jgi:microcystin-dependent protein
MSGPFVGQIIIFAGNFAPAGYAICDGSLLPIAGFAELFAVIGTTYGGDGTLSFAVPDLRGCAPIGQGQGFGLSSYVLGENVGVEQVRLTATQMPAHSHQLNALAEPGTSNIPTGQALLSSLGGQASSGQFQTPAYAPAGSQTSLHAASIGRAGAGQPHSNIQPYLALNFCIALTGRNPQG